MSGSNSKRKYARKKDLVNVITGAYGEQLEQARDFFKGKRVSILIESLLWKGDKSHTNTTSKKDIDSILIFPLCITNE